MKIYYFPNTGEQNLIFETSNDCVPNIGDTIIIYSSCYIVVKKVFYCNKSTTCCLLYLDKLDNKLETEKIKI
jgi:hypothetical protein